MKLEVRIDCPCLAQPYAVRNRIVIILVVLLVTWVLGGLPALHALAGLLR